MRILFLRRCVSGRARLPAAKTFSWRKRRTDRLFRSGGQPTLSSVDVVIPCMERVGRREMEMGSFRLVQQWSASLEGVDLAVKRESVWPTYPLQVATPNRLRSMRFCLFLRCCEISQGRRQMFVLAFSERRLARCWRDAQYASMDWAQLRCPLADAGATGPGALLGQIASVLDTSLTSGFSLMTFTPGMDFLLTGGQSYCIGVLDNGSNAVLGNTLDPAVLARPDVAAGASYFKNGGVQANSGGPYEIGVDTSPVPEPSSFALLVTGIGALGAMRRRFTACVRAHSIRREKAAQRCVLSRPTRLLRSCPIQFR
jgi:hypothetical protein